MFGLRSKLLLGFGGLLLIILVIGIQSLLRLGVLGQSIDVILRENYRSVIACQDMKECLERVDSAVLFVLLGYEREGNRQIDEYLAEFDKAMEVEGGNLTLEEEKVQFNSLQADYRRYKDVLARVMDVSLPVKDRRNHYFSDVLPLFQSVKDSADHILHLNQQNMSDANMRARQEAAKASQRMYLLLACGVAIAGLFIFYTRRWILHPITALTVSAGEIARGNLDLVVRSDSRDEMGQLSRAFDAMASSLREYRRTNEAKLLNLQRATQQALDSLSAPIAVVDLDGTVEAVTKAAQDTFGLEVGAALTDCDYPWMCSLFQRAAQSGRHEQLPPDDGLVQVFSDGEEKFFRPEAAPVLDTLGQIAGVTLILHDATLAREQDELKRGLASTVSHQLKTPLTSIRMALYLLLDDKVGPLTSKQEELLIAAREDSDRLYAILEDLLDIARIQSGRVQIDLRPVESIALAADAIAPFKADVQDHGIALFASLPDTLPHVQADLTRIPHVFTNLLSNAIRHTPPGGQITVAAREEGDYVWYSVSDTGCGIPHEFQSRVFEQFFRVPGEGKGSGVGLGLAIAKEIVTAHGGTILLDSQPGKGSTFSFSLRKTGIPSTH